MGDYRDIESTKKTIDSYMEAFRRMTRLCTNVEPGSNEFNHRVVLPTEWNPVFSFEQERLLPYVNRVSTHFDKLVNWNSIPEIVKPNYTIWKDDWFSFRWHIDFPFEIYDWENGRQALVSDDPLNPQYNYSPPSMQVFHRGILTLSSRYCSYKSWGIKDWKDQYREILSFFDGSPVEGSYREQVKLANEELTKWIVAMDEVSSATRLPLGK